MRRVPIPYTKGSENPAGHPAKTQSQKSARLRQTGTEQKRTEKKEHEAFKETHEKLLAETSDSGLLALKRFLETWQPDWFAARDYPPEVLDENVVFRLDGDIDRNRILLDTSLQLAPATCGYKQKKHQSAVGYEQAIKTPQPATLNGAEGAGLIA